MSRFSMALFDFLPNLVFLVGSWLLYHRWCRSGLFLASLRQLRAAGAPGRLGSYQSPVIFAAMDIAANITGK